VYLCFCVVNMWLLQCAVRIHVNKKGVYGDDDVCGGNVCVLLCCKFVGLQCVVPIRVSKDCFFV
jgi:hypothetical protein